MSVGHVARAIEESGIPTVTVMVKAFEHVAERMTAPRTLLTPFPMGRPFGAVGDNQRQTDVLNHALRLLDTASQPGSVEIYGKPFRVAETS